MIRSMTNLYPKNQKVESLVMIDVNKIASETVVTPIKQISRSEEFHFGGPSRGEMPHFMQFSVATRELCTLHCVLLNCNGTKFTGNTLSIPVVAFSQQLLRETTNFPQAASSLLARSFHPMI